MMTYSRKDERDLKPMIEVKNLIDIEPSKCPSLTIVSVKRASVDIFEHEIGKIHVSKLKGSAMPSLPNKAYICQRSCRKHWCDLGPVYKFDF
uniref:Uncharacterized protein n=1 Tax=Lactuca sativa TaxID=4236 RepID=A0A9R1WFR8_LACSA|nr:hypothetical protein LSAT_V11C200078380 [Lactuca sativa]